MNATMKRFLDECRARPKFEPDALAYLKRLFTGLHQDAVAGLPVCLAMSNRICAVIGDADRPFLDRLTAVRDICSEWTGNRLLQ